MWVRLCAASHQLKVQPRQETLAPRMGRHMFISGWTDLPDPSGCRANHVPSTGSVRSVRARTLCSSSPGLSASSALDGVGGQGWGWEGSHLHGAEEGSSPHLLGLEKKIAF